MRLVGFNKRSDPTQRISHHEVNFKRQAGMLSQAFHLVGKKEQVVHVMPIRDIDVESFRVGLDAPDFSAEIGKVRRPKRCGTLQHAIYFGMLRNVWLRNSRMNRCTSRRCLFRSADFEAISRNCAKSIVRG